MGLLQYTSDEMYSSTELVRKSKNIFDKLNKKEIEKAIILRDGKPGIILLDFNEYERIIKEYLELKNKTKNIIPQKIEKEVVNDDYESTLKDIEKLDFNFDLEQTKEKEEPLKEFWD
jgi:hypothetical protein